MKKLLMSGLVIVVLLGLFITGCSADTTEETTATEPTTTEPAEVIELRIAVWAPTTHPLTTIVAEPFAEEIERLSNGRVTATVFAAGALGASADHYDIVASGSADMAIWVPIYTPGRFPLTEMMEFPFLVDNATIGTKLALEMFERHPEMVEEYLPVKVLSTFAISPMYISSNNKKVTSIDDINGMRIRVNSQMSGDVITAMGGTPMQLAAGDFYTALERNTIDALIHGADGFATFNLAEVTKYAISNISWGNATCAFGINMDSWDALPADIQDIITNQLDFAWQESLYSPNQEEVNSNSVQSFIDNGGDFYELSAAEKAKWDAAAAPFYEAWLVEHEEAGLENVRAIFDDINETIARLKAEN